MTINDAKQMTINDLFTLISVYQYPAAPSRFSLFE